MAPGILVFVILLQLYSISVFSLSLKKHCGTEEVEYSENPGDGIGIQIRVNKARIENNSTLVCEKLNSYFKDGCFVCDSKLAAWKMVHSKFCGGELNKLPEESFGKKSGNRKLLRGIDCMKNKTHLSEDERDDISSEKEDLPLAIPGFILLSVGFLFPCCRPKRKETSPPSVRHNQFNNLVDSNSISSSVDLTSSSSDKLPPLPSTPQHRTVPPSPSRFAMSPQVNRVGSLELTINQITKATRNFSASFKLGEGGFGTVYRAVLADSRVVAVKRAKKEHFEGSRDEFNNEVDLLAKIDHRNLVRFLGFIDKGNERILITEYVSNGTLREHLDGQHGRILDFSQRLEIAIDIAHGLTYLHLYSERTIIHRDVKSSNILLTENFRAKVSDFGFAKSGPNDTEKTHISTKVKGTAGYLDPEYLRTYQLTPKSDVFSFGILLIEILSGRRPVDLKKNPDERITVRWAFKKFNEGNVREILDPLLDERVDDELIARLLNVSFQCAAPTRDDRPNMKEVGEQLWEIRKEYGKMIKRISGESSRV